jgi:hypothetical protein
LTSGNNTVEFTDDWGWYLIDSITVALTLVKLVVSVNVTSEAIAYAINSILGGTTIDTATPGYIGAGYVTGFTGSTDALTATLLSETEVLYDVIVEYAAIYGYKQITLNVNSAGESEVDLADTSTAPSPWANATASQILLNARNNTIAFTDDCKAISHLIASWNKRLIGAQGDITSSMLCSWLQRRLRLIISLNIWSPRTHFQSPMHCTTLD